MYVLLVRINNVNNNEWGIKVKKSVIYELWFKMVDWKVKKKIKYLIDYIV